MSVIAKLSIQGLVTFGTGHHVTMGCVAANDLMAMYATSEEDKLFSKASPWGQMHLHQPAGARLGEVPPIGNGPQFYVMVVWKDERHDPAFPGAHAVCDAKCNSLTDFGGTSKHVEFVDAPHYSRDTPKPGRGVDRLNWKMSVDNPAASDQFVPAKECWIVFYPAETFDRDQAIAAAHTPVPAVTDA